MNKENAIIKIRALAKAYDSDVPKIFHSDSEDPSFELEITDIKKSDSSEYEKGKFVGYMRAMVEAFELKNSDFN